MENQLYSVAESQAYLQNRIGRDALYGLAHSGNVKVIWIGRKKVLFPKATLDLILAGEVSFGVSK
jgi:hypothetical protein